MDWKYLFTSFEGRAGRQQWWLGTIVLIVANWIVMLVLSLFFSEQVTQEVTDTSFSYQSSLSMTGTIIGLLISIPLFYAGLALSAKRWHDRGKSGWWILINLVPLIGWLWALVENGFLKGTDGPNQYGPDPLAR